MEIYMNKQLFALSVLALGAMPAMASNFYGTADCGRAKFAVDSESESDTSFSVGAGYKFNQYFSAEIAYRDMGEVSVTERETGSGGDFYEETATLGFTALQASLVASYSLGETSSIYGRLGVADLELDASLSYSARINGSNVSGSESGSESKNKALFGIGYSHSFTPSIGMHVEYTQYDDIEELEISTTAVGISYNF
jgi:opacity protein-like surface antigen